MTKCRHPHADVEEQQTAPIEAARPRLIVDVSRRRYWLKIMDWYRSDSGLSRQTSNGATLTFSVDLDQLPADLGVLGTEAILHELACRHFHVVENPCYGDAIGRAERVCELLAPRTLEDLLEAA